MVTMNYPPQQAYPAAPMAQPKPRRWPWLVAVIGAFGIGVVVGVAASNQDETTPPTQAQGPATTMHSGIYQVGADVQPGQYETKAG